MRADRSPGRSPEGAQCADLQRLSHELPQPACPLPSASSPACPLPDDVVQREVDRIEQIEVMRLWRSPRQVVAEEIEDAGLRQVLDSLAIAIEKQESQKWSTAPRFI